MDDWYQATDDELAAVQDFTIKVTFRRRRELAFLQAERAATSASLQPDQTDLITAIHALVDGLWWVSKSNETSTAGQRAALLAVLLLLPLSRHPRAGLYRHAVKSLDLSTADRAGLPEALGLTWLDFETHVKRVRPGLVPPPDAGDLAVPDLSMAAASLVDGLPDLKKVSPPPYERSDEARRVLSVRLKSFRGSPEEMVLDFSRNGTPASALVIGDNGVGKSTLVDAIEFGLQGRIGRSLAFDSPLGPAAASFAGSDRPEVEVVLDDGSKVTRALIERDSGRLSADSDAVRPGFRLAPITLKRQDILRFLDTDALARGHVFFDYFPATASSMAIRPEESVRRLDDEDYQLRIQRTQVAEQLGDELGVAPEAIAARDALLRVLKDRFTDGQSVDAARASGRWQLIPDAVRIPAEHLLAITARLGAIKKERRKASEVLNPVAYQEHAALIGDILGDVGDELTSAFRAISRAPHVGRISAVFGRSGPVSLDIVVELTSGVRCFPQQVFSEGYSDLLAILFFVAVATRSADHGQARVLILDDVFQSVDASVRLGAVAHLLERLRDWQLILTVHDRLWFEQLRTAFHRAGHPFVERELRRWTFENGPTLLGELPSLTSNLELQLRSGDPGTICGTAGRLLEQASDQLSSRLGTSVTRRPGDKYTLGDLWPGVAKALKRTSVSSLCAQIDTLYSLRNLAGAHYNQWAESLSLSEAEEFGEAVLAFARATWCSDCHEWIGRYDKIIRCPGGHLTP